MIFYFRDIIMYLFQEFYFSAIILIYVGFTSAMRIIQSKYCKIFISTYIDDTTDIQW